MAGTLLMAERAAVRTVCRMRIDLGVQWMTGEELSGLSAGSMVRLDAAPSGTVDVYADGRLCARGELVDVDGKVGVRVKEIVDRQ